MTGVAVTAPVVRTHVGPAEQAAGCAYVHDMGLDGDQELSLGTRVEVHDEAGRVFPATVMARIGLRWQLTLQDR